MNDYCISTYTIAPSGCFSIHQEQIGNTYFIDSYPNNEPSMICSEYELYNPAKLPFYSDTFIVRESFPASDINAVITSQRYLKNKKIISFATLASYSAELIKIALNISLFHPNFILCLLRGAYIPTIFISTLTNFSFPVVYIPFQNNSERNNRAIAKNRFISELRNYSFQGHLKIAVIDTVRGGHGINNLCQIIHEVRSEYKGIWSIRFFTINKTRDINKENLFRSFKKHTSDIVINLDNHEVDDLIFEDWDEALGIHIEYANNEFSIKPISRAGFFLYANNSIVSVIESNDINISLTNICAKAITEDLQTDPNFRQTEKVIWEKYL